ncbi:transcriptional regulator Myc-like isoform X1 [Notolabrus celidotus]|uniref:transcriptional regulator Myc-like isoform X1 n=1 Tax=Notolabrus celidotus TaxID=1203425 RepID=UPI00148F92BA|nr:transcriptional regulator Myc-like isoform X1 [Notolabrus celidotus]
MPPVLTMPSMNYDYDYDTVQPYFLLDGEEEDFYPPPRSQLLPGPGEDIWKKFELLPTPPLSPRRRSSFCEVPLSAAEHLEAVSDLLDDDCDPSAALLQSFIIQDCMWSSSFAAAAKLERVVSKRLAALQARRDSSTDRAAADEQVCSSQVNSEYLQDFHTAATDCIDPSVVFPCSTLSERSEGSEDGADVEVTSELCLDTPPLSSSDSESEEEDEEEEGEEDGEEDEEIDVVTVDRRKLSQRSDGGSKPSPSPLVLKRSHIDVHQHNYAAAPQQPAGKRFKPQGVCSPLRQTRKCHSPRSDGEDNEDKRRTHNVLERQRRNELKRSFLALRDQIPALANNQKASKVVILKRATEFVEEVREDERRLLTMKDELRKRSRELRHRLKQLRTLP